LFFQFNTYIGSISLFQSVQKHAKNTLFNLEEEEELTHYGQSLSSINYFGDGLDSGDEADEKGMTRP